MDSNAQSRGAAAYDAHTPGGRFGADPAVAAPTAGEAFQQAAGKIGELKEYAGYLVAAKLDGYKVTARNLVIYAVLGVLGAVIGAAMLATAAVMLLSGIAGAISHLSMHLFGPRWGWIGPLLLGLLILGGIAVGVILGLKWFTRTSHKTLVAKYEDRKRHQRADLGHDVEQRAREQLDEQQGRRVKEQRAAAR